jgi:hypothetical protein
MHGIFWLVDGDMIIISLYSLDLEDPAPRALGQNHLNNPPKKKKKIIKYL